MLTLRAARIVLARMAAPPSIPASAVAVAAVAAASTVAGGSGARQSAAAAAADAAHAKHEEHFDVLDESGARTGRTAPRSVVHREGLYHSATHVWIHCAASDEVLLQRRAAAKDSWPDRWDISSAGHIAAGEEALPSAVRELEEELGIVLPASRFVHVFTHLERLHSTQHGRPFINNEFNTVYLIAFTPAERARWDPEAAAGSPFLLQTSEVSGVAWVPRVDVEGLYAVCKEDGSVMGDEEAAAAGIAPSRAAHLRALGTIVPMHNYAGYSRIFAIMREAAAAAAAAAAAGGSVSFG